jgi:archaellum component FlaG (FlaF/FlaG flagellin family)
MKKRGQAAVEFLTTYGWAFMLMIAVIAGIVYLDPLGSTPTTELCQTTDPAVSCDTAKVQASPNAITFPVKNGGSQSIQLLNASVRSVNDGRVDINCTPAQATVPRGDEVTITCVGLDLVQGDRNDVEVQYDSYTSESGESFRRQNTVALDTSPEDVNIVINLPGPHAEELEVYGTPQDVLDELTGNGTTSNPYLIEDDYDLAAIEADLTGTYVLANDVDLTGTNTWHDGAGWEPLPTFRGVLDGNGNDIVGLYIDRPNYGYYGEVGLFETVRGEVKNVGLLNVDVRGEGVVGALSGRANGGAVVSNVTVTGTVRSEAGTVGGVIGNANGDFSGLVSHATIDPTDAYDGDDAGGVFGRLNSGSLTDSYATGDILGGAGSNMGGLIGSASSPDIERVFATGDVTGELYIGGLVGNLRYGTVSDAYALGTVTATGGGQGYGGFAGEIYNQDGTNLFAAGQVPTSGYTHAGIWAQNRGTLDGSYYDTTTTLQTEPTDSAWLGGGTVTNTQGLTTSEMQGSSAATTMSAFDFTNTWSTVSGDYPVLQSIDRQAQLDARD